MRRRISSVALAAMAVLDDCTLDTDLADLETGLAELQAEVADFNETDSVARLETEISDLGTRQTQAEQVLDNATGAIAELCAPESQCDQVAEPPSTTPLPATAAGALLLLAGLGAVGFVATRSRG